MHYFLLGNEYHQTRYCSLQIKHPQKIILRIFTISSCCLSVDDDPIILYNSMSSPSIPSPRTGNCTAIAARQWHIGMRAMSWALCSWVSSDSTTGWLRWGRLHMSFTMQVNAVCARVKKTNSLKAINNSDSLDSRFPYECQWKHQQYRCLAYL